MLGLVTGAHTFVPKQFMHMVSFSTIIHLLFAGKQIIDDTICIPFQMTAGGQPVTGTNIISIIPGSTWGTKEDKVLIVGAHWDTVVGSPGKGQMLLSNKYHPTAL